MDHDSGAAALNLAMDALQTPGVGVVRFSMDEPDEIAAGGRRDGASSDAAMDVRADDVWHFGSIGKSMTAAIAESLVNDGVIAWDTRVEQVLPEARESAFARCTLRQMLSHRSGMRTDPPRWLLFRYLILGGNPAAISSKMFSRCLSSRPVFEPGTDFLYSNAGYGVAGRMLERVSGQELPGLIERRVFAPSDMRTARVAVPPQDGSAPLEHHWHASRSRWRVIRQGTRTVDDLAFIKPSGCVSGSLADLAAYGRWQLTRCGSVAHEPVGPPPMAGHAWRYGLGWMIDSDGSGVRIWHGGSTGGCFALLALFPERRAGVGVLANGFRAHWGHPDDPTTQALLALG